jgi:hypothetical protein
MHVKAALKFDVVDVDDFEKRAQPREYLSPVIFVRRVKKSK